MVTCSSLKHVRVVQEAELMLVNDLRVLHIPDRLVALSELVTLDLVDHTLAEDLSFVSAAFLRGCPPSLWEWILLLVC